MVSRSHIGKLLGEAGFETLDLQGSGQEGDPSLKLVEVEGFVTGDDPRLVRLMDLAEGRLSHVWTVGSFAVPLSPEEMASPKAAGPGR